MISVQSITESFSLRRTTFLSYLPIVGKNKYSNSCILSCVLPYYLFLRNIYVNMWEERKIEYGTSFYHKVILHLNDRTITNSNSQIWLCIRTVLILSKGRFGGFPPFSTEHQCWGAHEPIFLLQSMVIHMHSYIQEPLWYNIHIKY